MAGARHGLRLYSVTSYAGYSSLGLPRLNSSLLANPLLIGSDVMLGGGATAGGYWSHGDNHYSFSYTSTYDSPVRHPEWRSLGHSLTLSARTKPSARWNLNVSAAAGVGDFFNSFFARPTLGQVTNIRVTFDDLAAAVLTGRFNNPQLASLLTGAPLLESPTRTLLYGDRVFSSSVQTTLSYDRSSRFSVHFGVGGARNQHLSGRLARDTAQPDYLIPRTTSGDAHIGFSYSLTRRTQLAVNAGSSRSYSNLQDAYTTSTTVSLGRTMGRRWFLQGRGGVGTISPIRQTFTVPRGPQYLAGASLGFKTYTHTFLASEDRRIGDSYGLGAGSSLTTAGSWQWQRPGQGWGLFSTVGHQRFQSVAFRSLEGWNASAGISRRVSRSTTMQSGYYYFRQSGRFSGPQTFFDLHAVRLSFVWTPNVELLP